MRCSLQWESVAASSNDEPSSDDCCCCRRQFNGSTWSTCSTVCISLVVCVVCVCSQELCRRTKDGNTALHLCAAHNKPESLKLLLRSRIDLVNCDNSSGLTALEIAQNNGHQLCAELVCITHTVIHSCRLHWNLLMMKCTLQLNLFCR